MGQFLVLVFFCWCIWSLIKKLVKENNNSNKNKVNELSPEIKDSIIRTAKLFNQRRSLNSKNRSSETKNKSSLKDIKNTPNYLGLTKYINGKRVARGDCICGCNGVPLTEVPDYSIDYEKYRSCPARWRRKETGIYINDKGERVEWIPSSRRISTLRQRERKARKIKEEKEREALKKNRIKKKELQIAQWISQGKSGPLAQSVEEAKYRGLSTYLGKECSFGHTERLVRNGECVICKKVSSSLRNSMKRGAYPIELTTEEKAQIAAIYKRAKQLTKETGIQHHVDHIKPVSKGGTNHPDNLQILTAEENLKKGVKWDGD